MPSNVEVESAVRAGLSAGNEVLPIIVGWVVTTVVDESLRTIDFVEDDNVFNPSAGKVLGDIADSGLLEIPRTTPDVPLSGGTLPGRVVEDE